MVITGTLRVRNKKVQHLVSIISQKNCNSLVKFVILQAVSQIFKFYTVRIILRPSYTSSGKTARNCKSASSESPVVSHARTTSGMTVLQDLSCNPSAATEIQIWIMITRGPPEYKTKISKSSFLRPSLVCCDN
jgi:hypothetical protein